MFFRQTLFYFLILFLFIERLAGNSGDGTPYITNIKYIDNQQNFVWSVEQTFQGTILIAGKTGLLEFDSEKWTFIDIPDVALTLKASNLHSVIYIGGRNYIGYLSQNPEGQLIFNSLLADSLPQGNYSEIVETETCVYFYSTHSIICFEKSTNYHRKTWTAGNNLYLGLFSTGTSVYVNVVNEGLFEIKYTSLSRTNSKNILNKSIVFCAKYSDNKSLIGTDNGDLYLFDRVNFTPYLIDNDEFIRTGILSDGVFTDANTLVLSTINNGVLMIDKISGKTRDIINYDGGLPNDFIMDLFVDAHNGLWMAHSLGLSRIDTRLPMTNFSSYPGLTSSVLAVHYWNNQLYAATSTGVCILKTINQYTSREIIKHLPVKNSPVKRTQSVNKKEEEISNTPASKQEIAQPEKEEQGSKKNKGTGFFKKIFSKGESEEIKQEPLEQINKTDFQITEPIKIEEPTPKYKQVKYNQYIIKSKDFGFIQLPLINERCKLFIPFGEQLLALTDDKLFSINRTNEVKEIFKSIHIYTALKSKYHSNNLFIVTDDGIYEGFFNGSEWSFKLSVESKGKYSMTDVIEIDGDHLLIAHADKIIFYSQKNDTASQVNVYNPYSERVAFKTANGINYLLVGNAMYAFHFTGKEKISLEKIHGTSIVSSFITQEDNLWIRTENNTFKYYGKAKIPAKIYSFLKIFENVVDIQIDDKGNIWVVDNFEYIYQLKTADFEQYTIDVRVFIKEIKTQSGKYVPLENAKLKYSENGLTFTLVSSSYLKFNSNQYQYFIEGLMDNWSEWNAENIISIPFLPSGNYTFKVRARNLFGEISKIESFKFKIVPPFWRTPYFYIFCVILLIAGLHLRQRIKLRKHKLENEMLQQKVKERTIELELKNKAITDSIIYAERIQKGILPADELISSGLKDYFVLYKPKHIVSGDFYWLSQKENRTYIVAADCTGHGVPGAFMSMLGIAYLNEILRISSSDITAAGILEELRERISRLFSQETFKTNDGIDIALLIIDYSKKEIHYSGAYNPLYQVTSNKNEGIDKGKVEAVSNGNILLVYKADRFHVGKVTRNFKNFTNHIIPYQKDDTFYIFSDGYVDQFGGDDESKFKYGPFKNLVLEISEKPMKFQKEMLITRMKEWKGNNDQTDDILIWGLKL